MTLGRQTLVAGLILVPLYVGNGIAVAQADADARTEPRAEHPIVGSPDAETPSEPQNGQRIATAGEQPEAHPLRGVNLELLQGLPKAEDTPQQPAKKESHPTTIKEITEVTLVPITAHAQQETPKEGKNAPALTPKQEEIASLIRVALQKTAAGDFESANIAYQQLFDLPLTKDQQRSTLLEYARMLRKKGDLTKATAVYEKILKEYPLAEDTPDIYLDLGRIQRALGAYKTAISRFYNVINSTLKLPEDGASRYRQLAKTAQFEIAETHFQAGNYEEASRFYTRLRLLDLATVDRARAHFKSAYALFLAEDFQKASATLQAYMEQYPDDDNVPEARYLLAISYRRLQRAQDALNEALNLLRTEKIRTQKDPRRWAYWQRKTGNQIANEFFDQGDYASALTIYTTLSELSTEDTWKLPILYQMGICLERQGHIPMAIANYQMILDSLQSAKGDPATRSELIDLQRMATWRIEQISWQNNSEQRLHLLLPVAPPVAPQLPASPAPTP
jgi:tetratricopeptide (TPR) repeat protein